MVYTIIISLIVLLVLMAIMISAVQQYRQKQNLERRQRYAKFRAVLDQVEDLINITGYFPIGKSVYALLNARAKDLLINMNDVMPSEALKDRIHEYETRLKGLDVNDTSLISEDFELPHNDKQIIAMINALKRLRSALRSEHAKGRVDTQVYNTEDQRLQKLQLKISIETLIKRGENAYNSNMLGSARQYYEKALRTIDEHTYSDEYTQRRHEQIQASLEQITSELRDANSNDARKRKSDELEELFQPKKKW
ncbi:MULTISPECIES: hypothetical protein [unclassified Idiomarina]|jgi:hypothetical protein|uniref:hypothetical protein n=1 Tax=unclassified Idiomarina TaxID=2614829 RepID=UPI0008F91452|nr:MULTISPECIES: hypothetical protein [unclassified Idiomarina]OIN01773.1 hypothetical protein BFR57_06850 [Idiomarina sp. MD25a]